MWLYDVACDNIMWLYDVACDNIMWLYDVTRDNIIWLCGAIFQVKEPSRVWVKHVIFPRTLVDIQTGQSLCVIFDTILRMFAVSSFNH